MPSFDTSAEFIHYSQDSADAYTLNTKAYMLGYLGPALELSQKIPGIHEVMQEPFDVTNHAGNLWGGFGIAIGASLLYSLKNADRTGSIDAEKISKFRKFGVPAVIGATALVNCITETKWGVTHLPVAEMLGGETADPLDTIYSSVFAGLLATFIWKKRK